MKKYVFSTLLLLQAIILSAQTNLLTQGFESLPFPPTGWSNVRITGPSLPGNWARYGNGIYPSQTPHTGSWQIRFNSHNFGAGTSGDLRTASLNFTTAGSYTASFWIYRDGYVANDKLEVFVNTTQTSVGGTLLGTINRDRSQSPVVLTNGWYQYTFTIPPSFNTAVNYIIFKGTSAFGNDLYVDDISVDRQEPATPGCVLTYSPAEATSGLCINTTLSWDIVALASGYKMTIGSNSPDYNNILNNADLGVALTYFSDLDVSTSYGWKITPYNGFGEATGCAFRTFSTGTSTCYCIPVYLDGSCGTEDYIDDFSTTSGVTNITNMNTGCSPNPNNYTYFSAKTVTAVQGNNFNVSMQSGPDFAEGYAIWIDWNIDGDFDDAGEYAFNSGVATTAIVNGIIAVPYSATPGITRMRVRCAYNYVPVAGNACTTFNEGETEDYNIQINACATTVIYYADADGDTFGNVLVTLTQCTGAPAPVGYVLNNTDCNDGNAAIKPSATEICNGIDDNCAGGIDDGLIFTNYYTDSDADGFGSAVASPVNSCAAVVGSVTNNTDCNDGNAAIKPGATEICNGIDDNCVGGIDDGLTFTNYYIDSDVDGFGSTVASPVNSCAAVIGSVTNNTDCNDGNAAIKPGATEICNGIDDNCVGGIDDGLIFINYYTDSDVDGFGSAVASPVNSCLVVIGSVTNNTDCNDGNAAIKPGAIEICNSIDDNCNVTIDEGVVSATITPGGPTSFCKGFNVVLSANTGVGYTYQWTKNGNNISGATTINYTATMTGNYAVKVTVTGGCLATSTTTVVTVNSTPTATVTTPDGTDLCGRVNVRLKANNGTGFTYQWYKGAAAITGATAITYFATTTGNYKVKVTSALGCAKTSASTTIVKTCREEAVNNNDGFTIYPNPSANKFTITVNTNTTELTATIQIFSLIGEEIYMQNASVINGMLTENIALQNNIPSGLYIVKVLIGTQEYTKQLVIQY